MTISTTGGTEGWLDFLDDPGLTFYLIGEGPVPFRAPLAEVLADQFSWLKIDLALAHALAMKSGFDSPDPESAEIAFRLGHLLSGILVMDLSPLAARCGGDYVEGIRVELMDKRSAYILFKEVSV